MADSSAKKSGVRQYRNPDLGSVAVALLWGLLMLFLWPRMPEQEQPGGVQKSMVVADSRPFPADKIYLRPDLIAMPSEVSFHLPVKDDMPMTALELALDDSPALPAERRKPPAALQGNSVALGAEAIREISDCDVCLMQAGARLPAVKRRFSGDGLYSEISGAAGASLEFLPSERKLLGSADHGWDALVSLTVSKEHQPRNIFLEKPGGIADIDRYVVDILARPGLWRKVRPGRFFVEISFCPEKKNGVENNEG